MITADIKFNGLADVEASLKEFEPKMRRRLMRGSLRAAAKEIGMEARRRARARGLNKKGPVTLPDGTEYMRTGRIPKNIVWVVNKIRANGTMHASVAIRSNRKADRWDPKNAWYSHFVEFGVPARGIAAQPFMAPAMNGQSSKKAISAFVAQYQKELAKNIRKFQKVRK